MFLGISVRTIQLPLAKAELGSMLEDKRVGFPAFLVIFTHSTVAGTGY